MDMAERFGASLSVSLPGKGLFLVVAHQADGVPRLVQPCGGQVLSQLTPLRALVLLPLAAYLQLKGSRELAFIGPVRVDQERFAKVMGAHQSAPLLR